ncbi:MAG: HicB family protein, partial [Chloroflexi bacterium]
MASKISVSIPEDMLRKLDQAARQAHTSRSALLCQAV